MASLLPESSTVPAPPKAAPASKQGPGRLFSIDFIRGIGIISFIYWHSANYFLQGGSWSSPSVRFTLFATGLFIFTAGILLGLHYGPIFQIPARRRDTMIRLINRGGKILFIFLAVLTLKSGIAHVVRDAVSLLYVQRWDLPLQILAPIACLLISGPLLLFLLQTIGSTVFGGICLVAVVGDAFLPQPIPYFWHYYLVGCLGVWSGALIARNWTAVASKVSQSPWYYYLIPLGLYLALEGASVVSSRWYEVILNRLAPNLLIIVCFFLAWGLPVLRSYDLGSKPRGRLLTTFAVLGRHTLATYLFQVLLLNAIKATRLIPPSKNIAIVAAIAAVVSLACIGVAFAAESLGPRSRRLYSILLG